MSPSSRILGPQETTGFSGLDISNVVPVDTYLRGKQGVLVG